MIGYFKHFSLSTWKHVIIYTIIAQNTVRFRKTNQGKIKKLTNLVEEEKK